MKKDLKEIPIFFAIDDAYIPFLAVALESLIENASKDYNYVIKVLYTQMTEENKKKIMKYKKENFDIEFVNLNYYIEKVKDKLFIRDYYTKTTYFRLFLPDLYPQYDKAIYLDSDIVVLGDIAELYNEEIGDNLIAAVPDLAVQLIKPFQDYVEKVVGVVDYRNYFNAGILLMNLDELRKFKFQEKFLYLLENFKFKVAQDQDYLNRLCKGRVKILDFVWDTMPIAEGKVEEENIKIIHYNLTYKPWHFDDILYEDYFWKYAKKTEYYKDICNIKESYTEEQRFNDMQQYKALKELCEKESGCVGDDRQYKMENSVIVKSKKRLEILEKIKKLEEQGDFDIDVEDDPPTIPLTSENIDYLRKSASSKFKSKLANKMGKRFLDNLLKEKKLIIKEIKGIENLQQINTGAILTCNHFNPFDCFTIEEVFSVSGNRKRKKLYKVIREGNYTNFSGLYGFLFRNCDTLPLSSNKKTMVKFIKAVDTILKKGDFILIYPEQSMWWNYRKPKPLKNGAFNFAVRSNVPVIPIFITMEDSNIIGEDGFPIQEYTVNIDKPIYPDESLSEKENINLMRNKNYEVWKNIYEDFYGIPLEYTTIKNEDNKEEIDEK